MCYKLVISAFSTPVWTVQNHSENQKFQNKSLHLLPVFSFLSILWDCINIIILVVLCLASCLLLLFDATCVSPTVFECLQALWVDYTHYEGVGEVVACIRRLFTLLSFLKNTITFCKFIWVVPMRHFATSFPCSHSTHFPYLINSDNHIVF
jgi:hypothetical protein